MPKAQAFGWGIRGLTPVLCSLLPRHFHRVAKIVHLPAHLPQRPPHNRIRPITRTKNASLGKPLIQPKRTNTIAPWTTATKQPTTQPKSVTMKWTQSFLVSAVKADSSYSLSASQNSISPNAFLTSHKNVSCAPYANFARKDISKMSKVLQLIMAANSAPKRSLIPSSARSFITPEPTQLGKRAASKIATALSGADIRKGLISAKSQMLTSKNLWTKSTQFIERLSMEPQPLNNTHDFHSQPSFITLPHLPCKSAARLVTCEKKQLYRPF